MEVRKRTGHTVQSACLSCTRNTQEKPALGLQTPYVTGVKQLCKQAFAAHVRDQGVSTIGFHRGNAFISLREQSTHDGIFEHMGQFWVNQ